jgi:uncharacterized protein (TIGR02646 family)
MISINKPKDAPQILSTKGKNKRRALCAAYTRGKREFEFDKDIYGDKTVKEALIKAQHGKCFLCESIVTHIDYGDVEHFRPKAAYCQTANDDICKPGYYWLAYDWDNLFLACKLCNQRYKKYLFPLVNPVKRAISHRANIKQEEALFINPAEENPQEYISFEWGRSGYVEAFAINDNAKGKATIDAAGLNDLKKREKLLERRTALLKPLIALHKIATMNLPQPESDQAKEELRKIISEAIQDSAEYAGMVRAAIAADFKI